MSDADLYYRIRAIDKATPVEHIADVIGRLEALRRRARELQVEFEAALLTRIEETGRDVVVGETRYYVGTRKDTKNVAPAGTLAALFSACEGDFGRVAECLASDAFKPGQCRTVLPPDDFAACFVTAERAELREGRPKRQLLSVNERFARKGASDT